MDMYIWPLYERFQSSFELTGYITHDDWATESRGTPVSKLFRAYRLYNFPSYGAMYGGKQSFKALSSLQVI